MYSLALYPSEESMFIELVNLSSYTPKDAFAHLRGKLGEIPNKRK